MSKLTKLTLVAGLAGIMLGGGSALAQQQTFADPEAALEAFREALLDHVPGRGVTGGGHQRFSGKVGL